MFLKTFGVKTTISSFIEQNRRVPTKMCAKASAYVPTMPTVADMVIDLHPAENETTCEGANSKTKFA